MRDDLPDLTPQLLLHAYQAGIFPMAEARDDPDIFWVDPRRRGVFPLESFHISRSLAKAIRRSDWTITIDKDFEGVVAGCAEREETWINEEIATLYTGLFALGHAHSLEVWDNETLVGGVYGVTYASAFFGESMFSRRTNASKIALAYLVTHLRTQGFTLFDTQFLTDHLASLGAVEISRAEYHRRLSDALNINAEFVTERLPSAQDVVVQRKTQTS